MQKLDTLRTRACCAPLPREINNYYSRCHGKMKDKSDCKGSCYCEGTNCACPNKGLTGRFAETNNCSCCAPPKQNILVPNKNACSKCKRTKGRRPISPNSNRQKNVCRCCSPLRQKQSPQNLRVPKPPTEKKYILCYKPYEDGDRMLKLPIQSREAFKFDCDSCQSQSHNKNIARNQIKDVNKKNPVCTCGLVRALCGCHTEGMWCQGGGIEEAAPLCRRCGQKVYAAEKLVASGGAFHTSCFSCYGCHKALEVTNLYENQGEIYCKQCYAKYFGMSGYGYGATLLSPI